MSLSTSIGGGGDSTLFVIVFSVAGSSLEMWKMGCTAQRWLGSWRVHEASDNFIGS